ncbi:unnamed protein product [Meganyctiphanes norvegica]|uniref:Peptidase S1 domain-containing protein n=1 Tax=Meganyctiphanes norvegica TaxID=48144 RepID=A0AAV2R711_MEGNR
MAQSTFLLMLLALFLEAEASTGLLERDKLATRYHTFGNKIDLVRPRRTTYVIGAGDGHVDLGAKLAETNSRLNVMEGTLFRIEHLLKFLRSGGSHSPSQSASIHYLPLTGPKLSEVRREREGTKSESGSYESTTESSLRSANVQVHRSGMHEYYANLLAMLLQRLGPHNQHGGMRPHQLPPHRYQPTSSPRPDYRPLYLPKTSKRKMVSWMDRVCSEPCGIPNIARKVRHISQDLRRVRDTKAVGAGAGGVGAGAGASSNGTAAPVAAAGAGSGYVGVPIYHGPTNASNASAGAATAGAAPASATAYATSAPANTPAATQSTAPYAAPVNISATMNVLTSATSKVDEKDDSTIDHYRIVGGVESLKHKYPWQVYIQIYLAVGGVARCGGSIINDRYVITAGHCTYKGDKPCTTEVEPEEVTVTVAEHNINSINDDIKGVTDRIDVIRIIRHPKYCHSNVEMDNDIALLRLAEVLALDDIPEIGYVCLPGSPFDNFSGMKATVSGWGYKEEDFDERDHTDLAYKLQEVNFKIHPDCSDYPNQKDITQNMLCAGDEEGHKDACGGDSGGPLSVENNGQYTLAGLVSFGPQGGDCTGEGVYVKVAHYIRWIRENTMDAGC